MALVVVPVAPRALVVENDPELAGMIQHALENAGHHVILASSGNEGTECMADATPDLLIIDDELLPSPFHNGNLAGDAHQNGFNSLDMPPVIRIVQQAKSPGARWGYHIDKYCWLAKPFSNRDLLTAVNVVYRRRTRALLEKLQNHLQPYDDGQLWLDYTTRRCVIAGKYIHLSPTELRLLAILVICANKVVTQRQLLATVWGPEYLVSSSGDIVRQAVRTIRIKLRQHAVNPELIETVRGEGYIYRAIAPC